MSKKYVALKVFTWRGEDTIVGQDIEPDNDEQGRSLEILGHIGQKRRALSLPKTTRVIEAALKNTAVMETQNHG